MRFMRLLVTLLLVAAGCSKVVDDRRSTVTVEEDVETYVVEMDATTKPGQLEVEAVATCDGGDFVLSGGCAWGDVVDAHDMPLRPLADRPSQDGTAWECRGQNTGVGASLKTVTASAICAAH